MSALPAELTLPPVTAPTLRLLGPADGSEELVERAEAAVERHEYTEALATLAGATPSASLYPQLALRALLAESWAQMELGRVQDAVEILERAGALAEQQSFRDLDRAEVLFRLGCCRLKLSAVASAVSLLTLSLELCDRSGAPCDRLRARVLERRARCYARQRDWDAACADVERALELAAALGDGQTEAEVTFQASIVAERQGQWLLARCYAEEAFALFERSGDRRNAHRVLNNLGGINFLLANGERAVACLQDAFRIALELGDDVAAAYSMSSLAQVQLRSDDPVQAETHARRALELLAGREDHVAEIGNAELVLGRALLEQDRYEEAAALLRASDDSFERLGSISQRAAVWVAQGDLAARGGDTDGAARAYRRAAEALQDFHF